jgi:hypothetical protein
MMNNQDARLLIETYVDGWRNNDLEKIINTLSPDCLIIESHGPAYRGIGHVREWIKSWIHERSTVERWDITSFISFESSAVFEWGFECTAGGEHYHLDGISIVELGDDKIIAMREYRRTEFPYEWVDMKGD